MLLADGGAADGDVRANDDGYHRALLDAVPICIAHVDADLNILHANRSFAAWRRLKVGASAPARIGADVGDDGLVFVRAHAAQRPGTTTRKVIAAPRAATPGEACFHVTVSPFDADSAVVTASESSDVIAFHAEQVDMRLREFAHDGRNMLNAVIGYLDLMAIAPESDGGRRVLGMLSSTLTDLSRGFDLIAKRPERSAMPVAAVNAALSELITLFSGAEHDIAIRSSLHHGRETVILHLGALRRIVINLLQNARNHAWPADHPGGKLIEIDSAVKADELRITIRDNGPGAAGPRRQITAGTGRDELGLGLSAVQRLCAELGWTFSLRFGGAKGGVAKLAIPLTPPGADGR